MKIGTRRSYEYWRSSIFDVARFLFHMLLLPREARVSRYSSDVINQNVGTAVRRNYDIIYRIKGNSYIIQEFSINTQAIFNSFFGKSE